MLQKVDVVLSLRENDYLQLAVCVAVVLSWLDCILQYLARFMLEALRLAHGCPLVIGSRESVR